MIASALLLRGSAEGVSSYRIFGDEAYPQHEPSLIFLLPMGEKVKKGSQVLCFWCLMPKGEKVLSPKQKDRTPILKFSKNQRKNYFNQYLS
jgi:hypothetical protein